MKILFIKRSAAVFFLLMICQQTMAQDNSILLKEAQTLEQKFDEAGALEKYQQIAANDSANIQALVKIAELNCTIGERQRDKQQKANYFQTAQNVAQQAYKKDSGNADACYAMARTYFKMSEMDDQNKKLAEDVKQIKIYADKALAINANHAKANYILGKWHFELIQSGWLKRSGVKDFYHGIADTQVDSAAYYMEKARTADPYFAADYLELAKVYQYDHQPAKAIAVLNKLVKLPNRNYDDAAIKKEGSDMLAQTQ